MALNGLQHCGVYSCYFTRAKWLPLPSLSRVPVSQFVGKGRKNKKAKKIYIPPPHYPSRRSVTVTPSKKTKRKRLVTYLSLIVFNHSASC